MIVVVAACSEPQITRNDVAELNDIEIIDGRLSFRDEEAFQKAINDLETGKGEELISRITRLGHISLESTMNNLLVTKDLPANFAQYLDYDLGHRVLLNASAMVQVGNDVIKYHEGLKYFQDISLFGASEITKSERVGSYIITNYSTETSETGRYVGANLSGTPGSGGAQYDYFYLGDGSHRKFVNEWIATVDSGPITNCFSNGTARLRLRLKLEGRTRSSRPWSIAPDPRKLEYSFTMNNLNVVYYTGSCNAPTYNSVSFGNVTVPPTTISGETTGNYSYQVAYQNHSLMNVSQSRSWGYWTGDAVGSITQTYLYSDMVTPYFIWTDTML